MNFLGVFFVLSLINQVRVEQPTTFTVEPGNVATIQINEAGIYEFGATKIGDLPPDPDPDPDPLPGEFVHGAVPSDGYLATADASYVLMPKLKYGQRIAGTITVAIIGAPTTPVIPWRLLMDGVPQASVTIDTTQWPNGSHVISAQVMDQMGVSVRSGSVVVVINNGNHPFTELTQQAVIYHAWNGQPKSSLSWGRVDVLQPKMFPLDPQLDQHPLAVTDTDRVKLATQKVWWVEGLNHQGTPLWQSIPILVKNKDGDYFVKQYNPQGGGAGTFAINAQPYVQRAPAFDGPRGIGWLSPYASLSPDPHKVLASGQTGWIGVDKAGRVVRVDITGEVTTILGPRSVTGVVQTDPDDMTVTLADRIASGEKEYIGNANGLPLNLPHDIWVCDSFPFEGVIADQLNNRVVEIHFDQQRLMRSWPVTGVTSVWGSYRAQQELRIAWIAAAPDGLWKQVVNVDETGKPTGHGAISRIADIPKAFWVRATGLRAFVLTLDLGLYEVDLATNIVTERKPRVPAMDGRFVFMAIDEHGAIGPRERLYWSYTMSKTSVKWIDLGTWETGGISQGTIINRQVYGNWTAGNDSFGHYLWAFAPHATLPKMIGCGISSSSWFLWSGCLGAVPTNDPRIPFDGTTDWRLGVRDKYTAPAAVWGYNGHGGIGYSCDDFRDYATWDEAKVPMRTALDPFFGPDVPEATKEAMVHQLFMQRTRKHFQ